MSFIRGKLPTLISLALLLVSIAAWQAPSARLTFGLLFVFFNIVRALASVLAKHRQAHRQGRITGPVLIRNVSVETAGLLAAMVTAAYLGRYLAVITTQQIPDGAIRLIAGIATGLLVGMAFGILMHYTWGRLARIPAGEQSRD